MRHLNSNEPSESCPVFLFTVWVLPPLWLLSRPSASPLSSPSHLSPLSPCPLLPAGDNPQLLPVQLPDHQHGPQLRLHPAACGEGGARGRGRRGGSRRDGRVPHAPEIHSGVPAVRRHGRGQGLRPASPVTPDLRPTFHHLAGVRGQAGVLRVPRGEHAFPALRPPPQGRQNGGLEEVDWGYGLGGAEECGGNSISVV